MIVAEGNFWVHSTTIQLYSFIMQPFSGGDFKGTPPQFNFLLEGVMLHNKLKLRLNASDSMSREGGVTIEYLEQLPMPTPLDSLHHDNWVSSLNFNDAGWLVLLLDNDVALNYYWPIITPASELLTY